MKGFLTILLTILALSCFAQQERIALGLGTNGLGISYEREIQKQLHWGATANFQYIKGNVKNTILDNVVSSDYKTSSMQLEGFVKWYPRIANKKSKNIFNSRLYAKGGLALRLNPTYTANSTFWDKTMIGSFELNKDQVGYVNINIKTSTLQPMLLAGYTVFNGKKFYANAEAGMYFHGRPKVEMTATGILHFNTVNEAAIQRAITSYQFFPIIKIETGIKL